MSVAWFSQCRVPVTSLHHELMQLVGYCSNLAQPRGERLPPPQTTNPSLPALTAALHCASWLAPLQNLE
jgi:hypothetical protein